MLGNIAIIFGVFIFGVGVGIFTGHMIDTDPSPDIE